MTRYVVSIVFWQALGVEHVSLSSSGNNGHFQQSTLDDHLQHHRSTENHLMELSYFGLWRAVVACNHFTSAVFSPLLTILALMGNET